MTLPQLALTLLSARELLKMPSMHAPKIVARVTNDAGRPFNVVLVCRDDHYGLNDKLTHDKDDPMVEFWDATYENDENFTIGRGQFVSRYYLTTLTDRRGRAGMGLDLCGHEPAWKVTGNNVADAIAAVEAALRGDHADALTELRALVATYLEGSDDAPRAAQLLDTLGRQITRTVRR